MWLLFLLPACVVSALACARLCRVVAATGAPDRLTGPSPQYGTRRGPAGEDESAEVGLFETAYLAGGPDRVVDLVLVRMALRGKLLLAHTGWTTVARPEPGDALEQAVFDALGPEGQRPTVDLRADLVEDPAVREIARRLATAGLAVPGWVRERTTSAVRAVRHAMWLTVLCLALSLVTDSLTNPGDSREAAVASWFALPLILTSGTLLMSRVDVYPYTRWAAPAGQELLRRLGALRRARAAGTESLAAVAVGGAAAVRDPLLRAALRPPRRLRAADW